jgi:hypothetical protein
VVADPPSHARANDVDPVLAANNKEQLAELAGLRRREAVAGQRLQAEQLTAKEHRTELAARLAESAAGAAKWRETSDKMAEELGQYKQQETLAGMKAAWVEERQHGEDETKAEIASLRREAMKTLLRAEIKTEFKAKKAKLQERMEGHVESASIAKERVAAEKDDRIKDLQLSLQKQSYSQQDPNHQQQLSYHQQQFNQQGLYQQQLLGQQGLYQKQQFGQQGSYHQHFGQPGPYQQHFGQQGLYQREPFGQQDPCQQHFSQRGPYQQQLTHLEAQSQQQLTNQSTHHLQLTNQVPPQLQITTQTPTQHQQANPQQQQFNQQALYQQQLYQQGAYWGAANQQQPEQHAHQQAPSDGQQLPSPVGHTHTGEDMAHATFRGAPYQQQHARRQAPSNGQQQLGPVGHTHSGGDMAHATFMKDDAF